MFMSLLLAAACLPAATEPPALPAATPPDMTTGTHPPTATLCEPKVCPKLDEHGHKPRSCSYTSSMATGFQCILACVYVDTQWGTLVAPKFCE